jgi:hypothetical protein
MLPANEDVKQQNLQSFLEQKADFCRPYSFPQSPYHPVAKKQRNFSFFSLFMLAKLPRIANEVSQISF